MVLSSRFSVFRQETLVADENGHNSYNELTENRKLITDNYGTNTFPGKGSGISLRLP